jgi:hypothetical protein
MDESSLKLHVPARPGLVFEPSSKRRRQLLREGKGPDLRTRRSAVTLVAFVCDDSDLQQSLPQIIIVNEYTINKADLADISELCVGNVQLVRRQSTWVDAKFTSKSSASSRSRWGRF